MQITLWSNPSPTYGFFDTTTASVGDDATRPERENRSPCGGAAAAESGTMNRPPIHKLGEHGGR